MQAVVKTLCVALFWLNSLASFEPQQYEHRFDEGSLARVVSLFPYVYQAEHNTDVPPKYLLGIIYTESNAHHNVIGDHGKSYGLGQIRCTSRFNWIGDFHNPHISSCEDYLHPELNVYAVARVLAYARDRTGRGWEEAVEVYHQGHYTGQDWQYRQKVKYFGNLFHPYYKRWKKCTKR